MRTDPKPMRLPADRSGRWLAGALVALFLFRLWFAATLPMTGDEAYFVLWGERPAGGYYDHPPMVGWWLAALLWLGRAEWWLRLPQLLLPFALAWGSWWLLQRYGKARARYGAMLVLLQPTDVWNVLITTDTPVVLFSFLSVLAYTQGLRRGSSGWHALAGLLLGLAFLGKYFAALLGLGYAAHVLFARRDAGRWVRLAVLVLAALPGPAWNLWWNSEHCWANVLFNFYNRHDNAGFVWYNPLLYVVSLVYLATPWLLLSLWRARRAIAAADPELHALSWLAGVPLLFFGAMAFGRSVGLHWLLAFVPLLAVVAAAVASPAILQRLVRWSAVFAVLHVALAGALLLAPISAWRETPLHSSAVLTLRGAAIERALREPLARCGEGCELAMESYSSAAMLAYATSRPVIVFGEGSFHARQDDLDTDLRGLDGRDILVLRKEAPDLEDYAPYFQQVATSSFVVEGASFHLMHGQGFVYAAYRDGVLARVRERFYRIDDLPSWLPRRGCVFLERNFSESAAK